MYCDLCKQENTGKMPREIAGLNICGECNSDGYLSTRLLPRGMHLGVWCREKNGSVVSDIGEIDMNREFTITSLAEAPNGSGMHTRLQFENFGAKLKKIFEHEIQIGDREFDDMVWIRTNTKPETRAFLSLSKVQTVVMELISMSTEIDIDDAQIYTKATSKGKLIPREFLLHTAVLMHLLDEFSSP